VIQAKAVPAKGSARRKNPARLIGFLYLFGMATAVFASVLRGNLIVPGDSVQTAKNVLASGPWFRLSIASEILCFASVVVLSSVLYALLKPFGRYLALLAALFRVMEAAFFAVVPLASCIVLLLLGGETYLSEFTAKQLSALAMLTFQAQAAAYTLGLILFGLGSTLFAYLFYRSRLIPRVLAGFGVASSLVVLLGSLGIIVLPAYAERIETFCYEPIFLYEMILGVWLLLRGVRGVRRAPTPGR
jgi:hypothetical protein